MYCNKYILYNKVVKLWCTVLRYAVFDVCVMKLTSDV